jgi:hypothetical protein
MARRAVWAIGHHTLARSAPEGIRTAVKVSVRDSPLMSAGETSALRAVRMLMNDDATEPTSAAMPSSTVPLRLCAPWAESSLAIREATRDGGPRGVGALGRAPRCAAPRELRRGQRKGPHSLTCY